MKRAEYRRALAEHELGPCKSNMNLPNQGLGVAELLAGELTDTR